MPENTIPAFLKALDIGVTTLEMDVVISRDEKVVVSHEPWFSRTICRLPNGNRIPYYQARSHRIYGMSYDEVACYDVGSLRHPRFPDQELVSAPKPLLREVIRTSDQHARESGRTLPQYNIETKSRRSWDGRYHPDPHTFARILVTLLEEEGVIDRSIIQSFDERTLKVARRLNGTVRLSLLVTRRQAPRIDANLKRLGFTPDIYSPDQRAVSNTLVERSHASGMHVIPWTVNDAARMHELKEMGCTGLITDYPDRAVDAIS